MADLEQLEKDLHNWLQEQASSGKYKGFEGIVTGWTIWIDRVHAPTFSEDAEEDDGNWFTHLSCPGQRAVLTQGQATAAADRVRAGFMRGGFEIDEGEQ